MGLSWGHVNFQASYCRSWGVEGREVASDAQLGARGDVP
jgi:hypothetical protein